MRYIAIVLGPVSHKYKAGATRASSRSCIKTSHSCFLFQTEECENTALGPCALLFQIFFIKIIFLSLENIHAMYFFIVLLMYVFLLLTPLGPPDVHTSVRLFHTNPNCQSSPSVAQVCYLLK